MRIDTRGVRAAVVLLTAITGIAGCTQARAQDVASRYDVRDVMIPARDGVRLHTKIYTPKSATGPLPFIMKRTPYGVEGAAGNLNGYMREMAEDGYIFVFQDIRGKYGSEGTFVMQRPACPEPRVSTDAAASAPGPAPRSGRAGPQDCLDEGTDTYDTIEWLLQNVPRNNGRVGMLGVSYDGWTTIMAALQPHPALKAISPQASPADMWLGDDFHHNGAFRLSYGFEYAAMMETGKETQQFAFDRYDTYDWYLSLGPLSNVNAKYLNGRIPTWNDYVAHPDYDAFWQRQTMIPHIDAVKVPTLNVAGWWDQEDFYGPVRIYDRLERFDTAGLNYLVVGPWNHGGWSRGTGQRLGPLDFGTNTSEYFRAEIQAPWFAHWLKDEGTLDLPEAVTFETGSNDWRRWDAWPPKDGVQRRSLFFADSERLSFDAPSNAADAFDSYVSDPAHPV
ncbi:MAG: CocE/NonD family hydrolase, partial [Gemmatimonadota bacterium]